MKKYKTPFGTIKTEVLIFPLVYILILYLSPIALPQIIYEEKNLFWLWSSQEYIAEYFQFTFYFLSSIFSLIIYFKSKNKNSFKNISWLIFSIIYLFFFFEEISVYKLLDLKFISSINTQNEVNIHNLIYFQPHLPSIFISINLFLGWFGWRKKIKLNPFPSKKYCLYFLFCASFYTLAELKGIIQSTVFLSIPFPQEPGEFLMALGIFLYTFEQFKLKIIKKTNNKN